MNKAEVSFNLHYLCGSLLHKDSFDSDFSFMFFSFYPGSSFEYNNKSKW